MPKRMNPNLAKIHRNYSVGEAFARVKIDALLKDAGRNLTDGSIILFEHALSDGRAAAQAAFSVFLQDRSLTPPQIRFIEMVIEQLTARGIMNAAALYEPPFSNLHAGGPDELFAGKENVIEGIYSTF